MGLLWLEATLADAGEVKSASAVVDVDKLLPDDGSLGAENVLDTLEIIDSCELGRSGL